MSAVWWIPLAAYLAGSIPFGFLIVKLSRKADIRSEGSGNIGAANVARQAGPVAGILTLLLDAAKGYFAVWLAARVTHGSIRWIVIAAVCVTLGHIFTLWLRFHGGKGVATGLGVFLAICPRAAVAAMVLWFLVVFFWRYSSLGSIVTAAAVPILVYFLYAPPHAPPRILSFGAAAISLLVLWKHRENMQRLMAGTENRLRFRR